jgi:MYXO-CTERM domain-containing protein
MGDELDVLQGGRDVRIVGFGLTEDSIFGVQHLVETTLGSIEGDYAFLGGDGRDTCFGDSGAPAFVELEDGTLRAFGITSYGPVPCGQGGFYTLLAAGMPWLESSTGVDLTPCHDADGRWAPDERCSTQVAVESACDPVDPEDQSIGCTTAPPSDAAALVVGIAALLGRRRRAISRGSERHRAPARR